MRTAAANNNSISRASPLGEIFFDMHVVDQRNVCLLFLFPFSQGANNTTFSDLFDIHRCSTKQRESAPRIFRALCGGGRLFLRGRRLLLLDDGHVQVDERLSHLSRKRGGKGKVLGGGPNREAARHPQGPSRALCHPQRQQQRGPEGAPEVAICRRDWSAH